MHSLLLIMPHRDVLHIRVTTWQGQNKLTVWGQKPVLSYFFITMSILVHTLRHWGNLHSGMIRERSVDGESTGRKGGDAWPIPDSPSNTMFYQLLAPQNTLPWIWTTPSTCCIHKRAVGIVFRSKIRASNDSGFVKIHQAMEAHHHSMLGRIKHPRIASVIFPSH